jgi:hypothetical protein
MEAIPREGRLGLRGHSPAAGLRAATSKPSNYYPARALTVPPTAAMRPTIPAINDKSVSSAKTSKESHAPSSSESGPHETSWHAFYVVEEASLAQERHDAMEAQLERNRVVAAAWTGHALDPRTAAEGFVPSSRSRSRAHPRVGLIRD